MTAGGKLKVDTFEVMIWDDAKFPKFYKDSNENGFVDPLELSDQFFKEAHLSILQEVAKQLGAEQLAQSTKRFNKDDLVKALRANTVAIQSGSTEKPQEPAAITIESDPELKPGQKKVIQDILEKGGFKSFYAELNTSEEAKDLADFGVFVLAWGVTKDGNTIQSPGRGATFTLAVMDAASHLAKHHSKPTEAVAMTPPPPKPDGYNPFAPTAGVPKPVSPLPPQPRPVAPQPVPVQPRPVAPYGATIIQPQPVRVSPPPPQPRPVAPVAPRVAPQPATTQFTGEAHGIQNPSLLKTTASNRARHEVAKAACVATQSESRGMPSGVEITRYEVLPNGGMRAYADATNAVVQCKDGSELVIKNGFWVKL